LHNDELHSLYSYLNIIRVIKSRRMKWAGHVARMGKRRSVYRVVVGRPKVRYHWEVLGVVGRITLRWTSGRKGWMGRSGFGWLRRESSDGLL
jgi:hypothetical protein